jgi:prepilin-type processing-associated H-X9-DG protein
MAGRGVPPAERRPVEVVRLDAPRRPVRLQHPVDREPRDGGKASGLAIFTVSVKGTFVKQSVWGKKGSDRGVISCATTEIIQVPATFSRSTAKYSPFDTAWGTVYSDSTRHLKPGTSKKAAQDQQGLNMLFADGHAEPVSIVEAWQSFRDPGGRELATP